MRTTVQRGPRDAALRLLDRALIGFGLFLAMLLAGVQLARAAAVIPSVGITRSVNTGENAAAGMRLTGNATRVAMMYERNFR